MGTHPGLVPRPPLPARRGAGRLRRAAWSLCCPPLNLPTGGKFCLLPAPACYRDTQEGSLGGAPDSMPRPPRPGGFAGHPFSERRGIDIFEAGARVAVLTALASRAGNRAGSGGDWPPLLKTGGELISFLAFGERGRELIFAVPTVKAEELNGIKQEFSAPGS